MVLGQAVLGQAVLGQAVLGQCSLGTGSLGTVVLGQAVLGQAVFGQAVLGQAVLGQAVLGQAVLGQCGLGTGSLGTVVLGQWSWDSGLGTVRSWDSSPGTVKRSLGVHISLGYSHKVDGILTDRHCGGHDRQYAGNHKGRVSNEKNVIHREVRHNGWNEIKRHNGGRNESRERQNVWKSFHSTITTEANQGDDQVKHGATASHGATADRETTTPLELGDLMANLDQIDKKLKCSEEDREKIKKEIDTTITSTWTTILTWQGRWRKNFSRCQTR